MYNAIQNTRPPQGARVVVAAECWHTSMVPLMQEVKATVGGHPVYISFCIDGVDPAFCPGTGTPEIGGLTIIQALEIVRGCRGMNVVGGDMVEVILYITNGLLFYITQTLFNFKPSQLHQSFLHPRNQ